MKPCPLGGKFIWPASRMSVMAVQQVRKQKPSKPTLARLKGTPVVNAEELRKLEAYLQKLFNSPAIELRRAPKVDDMVELHKGDEFLGTVYRDTEDGDVTYQVNFAVLDIDLED